MNEQEVGRIGAIGSESAGSFQASQQVMQSKTIKEKMQSVESENPAIKMNTGGITVSFQVDESDNKVVITVSNKESGQIIRTIPFEKMQDISTGALFQYSK